MSTARKAFYSLAGELYPLVVPTIVVVCGISILGISRSPLACFLAFIVAGVTSERSAVEQFLRDLLGIEGDFVSSLYVRDDSSSKVAYADMKNCSRDSNSATGMEWNDIAAMNPANSDSEFGKINLGSQLGKVLDEPSVIPVAPTGTAQASVTALEKSRDHFEFGSDQ